jgi:lipopolysaccharide export system protein LptC
MSDGASAEARRAAWRQAMLPGSSRDRVIGAAKIAFPVAAGLLLTALVLLPLNATRELSFLVSKDTAELAGERMRVTRASYRGATAKGEPFEILAESAVQKTSEVPEVLLSGLAARIEQAEGPATVTAPSGLYDLERDMILVDGPIEVRSAAGYRVDGAAVTVDLGANAVASDRPVSGEIPMGSFSADRFEADLPGKRLVMEGRAKLRIVGQ